MPPKHNQHLFIVSTGSPQKPDVTSTYQRRAHAARVSRRRALEKSAATKQTPESSLLTTTFHKVEALQAHPDLLEALSHLAFFNAVTFQPKTRLGASSAKSKRGGQDSKTAYTSLLQARELLLSLPSQTNGLAFLPANQLIYEATRYAAMIYINVLVADPLIRAKLVSAITSSAPAPSLKQAPTHTNTAVAPSEPTSSLKPQTAQPSDPTKAITDLMSKNTKEILNGTPLQRQLYRTLEIKAFFNPGDSNPGGLDSNNTEHTVSDFPVPRNAADSELPDHKIPRHPSYALRYVLNSLFKDVCWRTDFGVMAWATFLGVVGSLPVYTQVYGHSDTSVLPLIGKGEKGADNAGSGSKGVRDALAEVEDEDKNEENWIRVNEERRKSDLAWLLGQLRERVIRAETRNLTEWAEMKGFLEGWLWCEGRLGEDIGQRVWGMVMNPIDGGGIGNDTVDEEMRDALAG